MTLAATGSAGLVADFATRPYPGDIPGWSYCIENGYVRRLTPATGDYVLDGGQTLTHWLAGRGQNYAPVLAYGSNGCPGRLAEKFHDTQGDGCVLLRATLTGAVKVWSRKPSRAGSIPLTLAAAPGQQVEAHLMLIPEGDVAEMDSSEGRGGPFYKLARLDDCTLEMSDGTRWDRPLAYVGHSERGPLLRSGSPVTCSQSDQGAALVLVANGGHDLDSGERFLPPMSPVAADVTLLEAVRPATERDLLRWLRPAQGF
jgi:hypothetical protein